MFTMEKKTFIISTKKENSVGYISNLKRKDTDGMKI